MSQRRRMRLLAAKVARDLWKADGRPDGPAITHADYKQWALDVLMAVYERNHTLSQRVDKFLVRRV